MAPPSWSSTSGRLLTVKGSTVADMQQDKQNYLALLIGLGAHTIRYKDSGKARGQRRCPGMAWAISQLRGGSPKRLGRELRNLYQAVEELPAQLLALVGKLEGKPDSSPEAKGE